jgi:hypothetical protein
MLMRSRKKEADVCTGWRGSNHKLALDEHALVCRRTGLSADYGEDALDPWTFL